MKKYFSLIIVVFIVTLLLSGCGINIEVTDIPDIKVNAGWVSSKDKSLPKELSEAYNTAVSRYDYEIQPQAYMKLTVDDGVNYGIICKRASPTKNFVKDYKLVILHQTPEGKINIVSISDMVNDSWDDMLNAANEELQKLQKTGSGDLTAEQTEVTGSDPDAPETDEIVSSGLVTNGSTDNNKG